MTLSCEHIPYPHLTEEFGTSPYMYSKSVLTGASNDYQTVSAVLNPLVCYAVKTNGNLSIIKHFASSGSGFDIMFDGGLARVLATGGDAVETISSGVGKSETGIEFALNASVKCFNMENIPEINRIQKVAARSGKIAPAPPRVNLDVDVRIHPYISIGLEANRSGIAYVDASEAYCHTSSQSHLRIVGIDCHIGSQLTDFSPLIEAYECILASVGQLVEGGVVLEHLNSDGGIGIIYQDENVPDLDSYAQAVQKLIGTYRLKLILGPGCGLAGDAGVLLTRVEFVKHSKEENLVMVDMAMNGLMRPALYDAYHHIEAVRTRDIEPLTASIISPIYETDNFLGKDYIIACEKGDLLLIRSAGVYGSSMTSDYNIRSRATEVLADGSGHKLTRQRETVEQQTANELACL